MKKYTIRYNPEALSDLADSFEWGVQNWGNEAARKWYNQIETVIERRLSALPASCPLAPESNDFETEVRQLLHGRYRVLFAIKDDVVRVLYIRGPYSRKS